MAESNINTTNLCIEVPATGSTISFVSDAQGNILWNIAVTDNTSDSSQLDALLQMLNIIEVKPYLTKAEITFESLPPIGLRARFREKLFSWRKSEYGINDETLSDTIASKVISWLQNQPNLSSTSTPTSSFSAPTGGCKLSKALKLILQDTVKGKAITDFYEKNGYLIDSFRADLINIILIYFSHDAYLSPKDLPLIVEEILVNFSNEIKVKTLNRFEELGVNVSIKIHFLHHHMDWLENQLSTESDEQGERFHQVALTMETRYRGKKLDSMLGDLCWWLNRTTDEEYTDEEQEPETYRDPPPTTSGAFATSNMQIDRY